MKRFILAIFILMFAAGILYAQDVPEQGTAEAATVTTPAPAPVSAETTAPGMITFSFKDADIRNVLRLIAAKSGVNIVYGPEVVGVVNMELKDVPWEQALTLILNLNGFAYQREGNVVKVLKQEDIAKESLTTGIFTLNYASAKDTAESVKQMLTERGSIKTDTRSNTIIVTDVPVNINKVEEILKRLDMRTPQVLIETKIVQMSDRKQKDLGLKWASLQAYTLRMSDPVRNLTDTINNVRESTGTESWAFGDGISGGGTYGANTPRYDPNYSNPKNISSVTSPIPYTYAQGYGKQMEDTFTKSRTLSDIRSAILSADDFELVISALQSQSDATLISNPRVLTANNETAQVKVVSEYPVPNYTFDTSTSAFSITGFDYKDIGVTLDVTPNISADGYVTMKIEPQVSVLIGKIPFTAGGATVEIPYIGRKKAIAKLVIKSGDTLAIGGLIDQDNKTIQTKVPLLGDLPFLGRLFRHDSDDKQKTNIIFFITAVIIDENTKKVLQQEDISNVDVQPKEVFEKVVGEPPVPPALGTGTVVQNTNRGYISNAKKQKANGKGN